MQAEQVDLAAVAVGDRMAESSADWTMRELVDRFWSEWDPTICTLAVAQLIEAGQLLLTDDLKVRHADAA